MAHPQMFADDDPMLLLLRETALALPGAAEKVSHGRPAFFTKKVFAYYGGSIKVDGEYVQHSQSVMVMLDEAERAALVEEPYVYVPAYLGPYGWVGVDLAELGWDEVVELVESSYRETAPKKLVGELDRRGSL